ncbi:MAG: gliding motility-associated transport system permease protein gldG [Clostridiales bacterium]|nr:gliding motility-associated transport system permease protein gldG [Clostridiales bacterium]
MIGFVFMAFFLAILGIYTVAYNLVNAYSNFEYVLNSLSFVLILLVPIITMRVIAEEKKQKTEQLLYTAPISVEKIVLGKFFAVLTLFLIPMAISMCYPLILRQFGTINFATAYGGILGFSLMGATYIALGVFISSLTESQVIAAVISFLAFLLTDLMPAIANILPSDKVTCVVVLYVIILLVAWMLYFMMHSFKVSLAFSVVFAGGLTALYFLKSSLFDGLLVRMCNGISIMSRFDNFKIGIIDVTALCYYGSIIVFFLFLTIVLIKQSFTPKRLKSGAYQSTLISVVIAILVVVNLIAAKADLQFDVSSESMYTLTDATKTLIEGIKDPVTIYYMVADGEETAQIHNIIKQYNGLNGKLKVEEKDPVLYPNFSKQYTNEDVSSESVIVVNETNGLSKYVPYSDMEITDIDYNTYQQYTKAIDVEGQITSAIQYVTTESRPKMYIVTGHGEAAIGDSMKNSIKKLNIDTEELATLTAEVIPTDCDLLVVNAPTSDLSKDEVSIIQTYLENGGKAILNVSYTDQTMDNYDGLLEYYGITPVNGVVIEEAGNYAANYPSYIVPSKQSHAITDSIDKYMVLAVSQGLEVSSDIRSTVTIDTLLTTSDQSYSKVDVSSNQIEKEKGDISGPFVLGAAITEKFDDKETKIVTIGTGYLLDDTFTSTGQLGNETLFLNSVSWLSDTESGLSIPERSVTQTYLTVTPSSAIFWGAILVVVIPVTLLIAGLVIWLRRRKNG